MKIGVIGANGKAGRLIAAEAKKRGHEVTAIVRNAKRAEALGVKVLEKDLFSLKAPDLAGLDVVISAFGTPMGGPGGALAPSAQKAASVPSDHAMPTETPHGGAQKAADAPSEYAAPTETPYGGGGAAEHLSAAEYLIGLFRELTKTRLIVIGGGASLYTDPLKKTQALDAMPDFLKEGVPGFAAKALKKFQESSIGNWTMFSPALNFDAFGSKSGTYTPGTDFVINNAQGESYLSYADAASALVDEAENGFYRGRRFTAVSNRKSGGDYHGILPRKPVFEGLSRWRQPFNYELVGKSWRLLMDSDPDYWVSFRSGHELEWGVSGKETRVYHYESTKGEEQTYFVNFELQGSSPRAGFTLIVDLEQRLVTLCKTFARFSAKYPTLIDSEYDFGAIVMDGYPIPKKRHARTADLLGKSIHWHYAPDFEIIHTYYSPHHARAVMAPSMLRNMPPPTEADLEAFELWRENPYDEKAAYIKIKRNVYLVEIIEQHMSFRGLPGNSLLFLMDLERVRDVGRSFGHAGNVGPGNVHDPENYMFAAYGEWVQADEETLHGKSVYIPD